MSGQIVAAMKEVRTWVILIATVLGTQGVSALVVPQYAEYAAQKEVETDVSKAVVALARAHNNHAEHIEALQEEHEKSAERLVTALAAAKAENAVVHKRLKELQHTLEALVLIHGERTVARYAGRVEMPAAPEPAPQPEPVARVKVPEKARRLPVSYAEIQQQLAE